MDATVIEGFRLSPQQKRLWSLQQGGQSRVAQCVVRLEGDLNARVLEEALGLVVARADILRTVFRRLPALQTPVQVVTEWAAPEWRALDLGGGVVEQPEAAAQELAQEESRRPFDFERGPLVRALLLQLSAELHLLIVTLPSVCADAGTLKNLFGELGVGYAARLSGDEPGDESLPYTQVSEWQNELLEGEDAAEGAEFWRDYDLATLSRQTLPYAGPAPSAAASASLPLRLSPELAAQLEILPGRHGAAAADWLLACWHALLWRLTRREEIVVGESSDGREFEMLSGALGPLAKSLPVRVRLSGRARFGDVLARSAAASRAAREWQEHFVWRSGVIDEGTAGEAAAPLYLPFGFEFDCWPAARLAGGLTFSVSDLRADAERHDVKLSCSRAEGALLARLHYDAARFDLSDIIRLGDQFQTLLAATLARPDAAVEDLDLLGEAERHQLLVAWNDTGSVEALPEKCLHELFAAQAARTPDRAAVVYGGAQLTFAELDAQSDGLARELRSLGVGPDVPVGLCMERGVEMIVGLLGILKAGGAYLPLDPGYPPERLRFMLEDARAVLVVSRQPAAAALADSGARVVFVGGEEPRPAEGDGQTAAVPGAGVAAETAAAAVRPDNLAYVIYTSGSTGRPKGVMIQHRSVINLASALRLAVYAGEPEHLRVGLNAPLAFDGSVKQLVQLLAGHTLYVVPEELRLDATQLLSFVEEHRLDALDMTPSQLKLLLEAGLTDAPGRAPRLMLVGGEALDAQTWAALSAQTATRFFNVYGPTECTVDATACDVRSRPARPTIGRPLSNVRAYVLDEGMRPSPVGVAGELYVGGAGVARGYLGRPGLTAARFVPDPFAAEAGARLYRTGDLARFRADGQIELLGRRDRQVKVRGFRVEPDEIEAALAAHPGVREAAVVAHGEAAGDRRLVAYTSPAGETAPDADALRRRLKGRLPEHMIPSAFVALDRLPLTPSGKVDRGRLPSPDGTRPNLKQAYVAPRTALEEMLCETWRGILRVEEVGVYDNFFELGGDSIHAAVFVNSLQKSLNAVVYVVALFDAPNVAALAAYLSEHYPEAVARVCGGESGAGPRPSARRVDAARVAEVRELIDSHSRPESGGAAATDRVKNPPAVFVLSPPRSGSTLLRVMLAGHPSLFAPPELELLSFRTLEERREALAGRYSFWLEGTVRALMQLDGGDAEQAAAVMRECEERRLTTRQFYGFMQERIGGRMLVEKTPSYALEEPVLRRAEDYFDGALYVHLLRHPLGMIRSFEDAKLEQVFFRYPHRYARRELAELIWTVSQQNILNFLADIPPARRHSLKFEELVTNPRAALEGLCAFLGLEFHPEMLRPYGDKGARMTDGIHPLSKMLGDVKFHAHDSIDAKVAERWKDAPEATPLGNVTRELAATLGYEVSDAPSGVEATAPTARELTPMRAAARGGAREFPLSFAQQRLWFIDRLTLDSPFYNIPEALRLTGPLDVAVLERSFAEVVRRHEALRTSFTTDAARPVQIVNDPAPLALGVTDLSGLPEARREQEAMRLAVEEAHRPFDLSRAPLTRAGLLRLGAEEHVLLITTHHIVSDGWSVGVFLRELSALYAAYLRGEPSPLAELPVQYADFAVWQREWLQGEVLEEQLRYWRRQLGGELPVLDLPTDRPRPPALSYKGADLYFELPEELTARLKEFSRREGVTLFMSLLAAFNALLHRYTRQTDLVVGVPIAGRNRRELEGLVGFFVNTLALRTDLSGRPSFRELLARVRAATLGAYAHQELPFEKLVEELHPQRDMSRNPLFQVTLALQNAPLEDFTLPGLQVAPVEIGNDATRFDLEFHLWEGGGALAGNLIYNTDLFDAATIEQVLGHFRNLLEGVIADPDARLSDLPLLTEAQSRQVLDEWNDTRGLYPRDACVHELFEAQVTRTPDAVAVVAGDARVSYRELNRRANRLARRLRALGVGPESRVGVLMERTPELVSALLAVLKAGGAYVPLDPAYPKPRLRFMLEDAGARVLLTERKHLGAAPDCGARVVCLDGDDREEIDREGDENLRRESAPDNLAYVIYTSGSTGRPKGVCVDHRAITRLVCGTNFIELSDSDCVAQASTASFDAATFEIWGALLHGARLDIVPRDTAISPHELAAHIRGRGVTVLFLTTALFNQIAGARPDAFAPLRCLLFGGEAVDPKSVREVLSKGRPRRLLHVYGPTENTTFSTWHAVGEVKEDAQSVPIGGPVMNTQAYVLDADLRPVPVGVGGELCLGGDGLMRGYLNRPGLTASKLVPHPFGAEPGARLYRTGDLVRFLPGGAVEFMGRIDRQVKVRGLRIEPGEIESVIAEHPSVRECVVTVREDRPGERRLAAYVVAAAAEEEKEAPGGGLRAGQVEHWQKIFDDHIYSRPSSQPDPSFNITGWNSTYTDEPLPAEEMRVWLDDTLAPIRAAAPRRVLEIGCGTGLLLARLATGRERYWGTDVSKVALEYVRRQVLTRGDITADVRLLRRAADDFDGVEPQSFDAVIINSVAQYFPDAEYLLRVLEGAARAVRPGGFIFVGDLRSLPLLETFHASVQLFKAPPSLPLAQLREQARTRAAQENELAVDPALFFALRRRLPQVGRVEVRPKRGRYHNELTRFRYQVLLHVGGEPAAGSETVAASWLDWDAEGLTLDALRRLLDAERPAALALARVPNARLAAEVKTLELLADEEGTHTAGELRALTERAASGVDPEDLHALGDEFAYGVDISWARHGADGRFDVLLSAAAGAESRRATFAFPEPGGQGKAWKDYGNNPLRRALARELVPRLRAHLQERLPDYMVPADFVMLDALPLNANGKVDRRALPAPDLLRPELEGGFVAPRTPVEERVAGVWSEVLGVKRVGVNDNFFDLGGHSLVATQVVTRLCDAFEIELPLRCLFETPTVAGLSVAVVQRRAAQTDDELLAQALGELEQLSEEEVRAMLAHGDGGAE